MKVQVSRTFKSYFWSQKKNNKKAEKPCIRLLQLPIHMCRGAYISYLKINVPIFYCSLFFEEYLNSQVRINKMINELNVDYHPSPSELTSRIHSLIFLWTPKVVSQNIFWIFSPSWWRKNFKFIITGKYICESENRFLFMPPNKTLP